MKKTLILLLIASALTSCASFHRTMQADKTQKAAKTVSRVGFWCGITFITFSFAESFKTEVNQ